MEPNANRSSNWRANRIRFYRLIVQITGLSILAAICSELRADIPWPEVVERLAYENERLARRPQGHNGEYFVVCTLYYTPMESGFTSERGFDATPITKPGLHGRTYPRDFLRSVKKEGFGRIVTPVNGRHYIRYNGGDSFALQRVFGSTRWKIMDTGGGLRRWQIDCYFGEDEPLGPGKFMGRPRATTFEYAYANARIAK